MISLLRRRGLYRYGLFALLLAVMFVFMIWPIMLTVRGGFTDTDGRLTLYYILSVFRNPVMTQGLTNSLIIATGTTGLCLLISLPLALLATRFNFLAKAAVTSLIMVPLILPPFVGAIGLRAILGRFGALNALLVALGISNPSNPIDYIGGDWWPDTTPFNLIDGRLIGVIVMEVLHLYPIAYLNLTAALANLDPTMDEAACNVGAGPWRRFFRVTLPLIMPGLFAGATIVFIWSFTELGTPLMLDYYNVTPVQIFWGINEVESNPQPYALVAVMFTLSMLLYLLGKYAIGRRGHAMQGHATIASSVRQLTGLRSLAALTGFVAVISLAVLPHVGVIFSAISTNGAWYRTVLPDVFSFDQFEQALSHEMTTQSIRNSLVYALTATVGCVAIGLTISYLNIRLRIHGGWLLDSLAMLPLAVPGLVMAFGYVAMTLHWPFGSSSSLHRWFSVVGTSPNPVLLLVIAYAIRRLPYVVRSVSAGLEQTSASMEEAALNLGASTFRTIRRIVIPLITANLIAGAILAFSFSMLEVSDSLILAQQQRYYPITKAIFEMFQRLGDGPHIAAALGVWGMALLAVTMVGATMLLGKRLGAIFRV